MQLSIRIIIMDYISLKMKNQYVHKEKLYCYSIYVYYTELSQK